MAADQVPAQTGQAEPTITRIVRAITQPGGKDVDWERVRAVGVIVGSVAAIYGLKHRSWRNVNTAATLLVIAAGAAGRLKERYVKPAGAPEDN